MKLMLVSAIALFVNVMYMVLFANAIISWIPNFKYEKIKDALFMITEPILAPIRNVLSKTSLNNVGMDLSPIVAMLLLTFLEKNLL